MIQSIRQLTSFAEQYEDDFLKAILGHSMKTAETDRARRQRELDSLLARDRELDTIFERLYEDNLSSKITDERFAKMSRKYEQEQGELAARIKTLRKDLKNDTGRLVTADTFLAVIRKYTGAQELSQRMLTELIDHINVYHAEKVMGEKTQRVTIHYNCIGVFDVPAWENIPDIDILLETRKGVAVSYSPSQRAG